MKQQQQQQTTISHFHTYRALINLFFFKYKHDFVRIHKKNRNEILSPLQTN